MLHKNTFFSKFILLLLLIKSLFIFGLCHLVLNIEINIHYLFGNK